MQRRILLAVLGGASSLAVTGARAAGEALVTIDNFAFAPAELTISTGSCVTWIIGTTSRTRSWEATRRA
ncbi:cupredoxin domain-containing protein [Dankookia rubra]|uniref:hypothetical protein n=1 Tax=Dankookia rubra TaxID=1442381 RepID=UPI0019D615E8|nr:hypothetical protein [Dankookia rubra]